MKILCVDDCARGAGRGGGTRLRNTHRCGSCDHPYARKWGLREDKYQARGHAAEPGFKCGRLDPVLDGSLQPESRMDKKGHCPRVVRTCKNVDCHALNELSLGAGGREEEGQLNGCFQVRTTGKMEMVRRALLRLGAETLSLYIGAGGSLH